MPYHFAVRALRYTSLVDDAVEIAALWERLTSRLPGATALIVMPNHVHTILSNPDPDPLLRACRAYARWRNAARGESGAVWQPLDPPKLSTPEKLRRDSRYVHLNECRAHLVRDPLESRYSIYRDVVGLAPEPLRRAVDDVAGMHRYVSSDPTVAVTGTQLPTALSRPPTLQEVAAAAAGLYRAPLSAIRVRGPTRRLFVVAARTLTSACIAEIAEMADVCANAVQRVEPRRDALVELVARVAGDARIAPVPDGSFWAMPAWAKYAEVRGIRIRDR